MKTLEVDVKTKKILSIKVTDEHAHDSKMLPRLIEDIVKSNRISVCKAFADGAYDNNAVFACRAENEILSCKVRRNARVKKTNHIFRNLSVISQKKNDFKRWKNNLLKNKNIEQ